MAPELKGLKHCLFRTLVPSFLDLFPVWGSREKAFNSQTVRKVAAARDALADARYEAEQREGDPDEVSMLTKVPHFFNLCVPLAHPFQ